MLATVPRRCMNFWGLYSDCGESGDMESLSRPGIAWYEMLTAYIEIVVVFCGDIEILGKRSAGVNEMIYISALGRGFSGKQAKLSHHSPLFLIKPNHLPSICQPSKQSHLRLC